MDRDAVAKLMEYLADALREVYTQAGSPRGESDEAMWAWAAEEYESIPEDERATLEGEALLEAIGALRQQALGRRKN